MKIQALILEYVQNNTTVATFVVGLLLLCIGYIFNGFRKKFMKGNDTIIRLEKQGEQLKETIKFIDVTFTNIKTDFGTLTNKVKQLEDLHKQNIDQLFSNNKDVKEIKKLVKEKISEIEEMQKDVEKTLWKVSTQVDILLKDRYEKNRDN